MFKIFSKIGGLFKSLEIIKLLSGIKKGKNLMLWGQAIYNILEFAEKEIKATKEKIEGKEQENESNINKA